MKLPEQPMLPQNADSDYSRRAAVVLVDLLARCFRKVNGMASGRIAAADETATAAPTAGTWAQGDFVRSSAPIEAGSTGSKYVITGWLCVSGGTPGTWVAHRVLTGN